jgi:acetoin utilization deacetylase AcuC-like enzyme
MTTALAIVDDPLFSLHAAPGAHPERPERLDAARAGVAAAASCFSFRGVTGRDPSEEELLSVHHPAYLETLDEAAGKTGYFDADTFYGPHSVAAARRAAGSVCALVDALGSGLTKLGLALVRPPGHHARPASAMGFCLLNNVAVAAAHARSRGVRRVVIVDWDVHHGNGTQEIFYDDPSVLYMSLHQFPFYPGTGDAREVGSADGRGYTVNIPLSAGAGDAAYAAAFDRVVGPVVEQFAPELVIVSAGFDAHRRDPLASMEVTEAGYAHMLRRLVAAAPEAPLALVLEGGYDLTALSESLRASLEAATAAPGPKLAGSVSSRHEQDLERVTGVQRGHWRLD